MPIYNASVVQFVYFDERSVRENEHCRVQLDVDGIVVSYRDVEGWVEYVGNSLGSGHFELRCEERKGKATLHMFDGGSLLEGSWQESRDRGEPAERGFWRIFLRE